MSREIPSKDVSFTAAEHEVLRLLGAAFNAFNALPKLHPADLPEFVHYIHALQNMVIQRPGARILYGIEAAPDETPAPPRELLERLAYEHPDTNKHAVARTELRTWLSSSEKTSAEDPPSALQHSRKPSLAQMLEDVEHEEQPND